MKNNLQFDFLVNQLSFTSKNMFQYTESTSVMSIHNCRIQSL